MKLDFNRLLDGKKAVITTGARGIGRETAMLFAQQGARVFVGGRNEQTLSETMKDTETVTLLQRFVVICQKRGYRGMR